MIEKPTLLALFDLLPEPVKGALLGTVVAGLRVMYDDREPRILRRVLESLLCGAIALGVASGVEALGLAKGIGTFVGGAVGLIGADQVRSLAQLYAARRLGQTKPLK